MATLYDFSLGAGGGSNDDGAKVVVDTIQESVQKVETNSKKRKLKGRERGKMMPYDIITREEKRRQNGYTSTLVIFLYVKHPIYVCKTC